jgi:hypothetical protein
MTSCKCGCGRTEIHAFGLAQPCYKRWLRAGRPPSGPPAALSMAEQNERMNAARLAALDPYDSQWEARRAAAEPERRATQAKLAAGDLIRCVAARDAEGIARLMCKITLDPGVHCADWRALGVVLAECADPARTAVVTGMAARANEPRRDVA